MTEPADRRAPLLVAKLTALVRDRWPDAAADARPGSFPGGAALTDAGAGRMWILLDDGATAVRRLGGALALAGRAGAGELHLLVESEEAAPVLARRAALFAPSPAVWAVDGRALTAAVPAAPATDPAPAPEAELFRPVLAEAGLETVVEGGVLLGEVLGLEIARVVLADDGSAHIEAGVGRFDREVGAMMFAELSETDALVRAAAHVAELRRPGAARHPLNQLVPERWLRSVLVAHPDLVGAAELRAVGSAVPRANLKETGVATAVGTGLDGEPMVVTCSTGVDLELVPSAADDRLTHAPRARLVLAVPAKDALSVTTELAGHLADPATVVPVGDDWPMTAAGSR
ncbi:MAG: hypothetical protein JWO77_3584 [Ilumatobacteraceae bacterium]|nr:hypothetical protein [Ilumatobacteraceae bacterium]